MKNLKKSVAKARYSGNKIIDESLKEAEELYCYDLQFNFITYKQSLALVELGFDEPVFAQWFKYDGELRAITHFDNIGGFYKKNAEDLNTPAILKQQAFRFFRHKYNFNPIHYHYNKDISYEYILSSSIDTLINVCLDRDALLYKDFLSKTT